jgi:hypothetical protein
MSTTAVPPTGATGTSRVMRISPHIAIATFTVIAITGMAWGVTSAMPVLLDDAYIPLYGAHVLVDGNDAVFHAPALTGATSPPHLAMLALLVTAKVPDVLILRLVSTVSLLAYVGALWALASVMGWRVRNRVLFVALGLATGSAFVQITSGLETGLATAAVLAAIAAVITGRTRWTAALVGIIPWIRPDLALIAAAIWIYAITDPRFRRPLLVWIPVAIAIPFVVWIATNTGHVLPNTVAAKRLFFAEGCLPLSEKLLVAILGVAHWVMLVAPAAVLGTDTAVRTRLGRLLIAAVVATLTLFVIDLPGAVTHNNHRYLYPIALPFLLYGVAGLSRLSPLKFAIAVATAVLVAPTQLSALRVARDYSQELTELRTWVDANLEPGRRIAVHDVGVLAFTSHELVDIVGLKTPASVEAHARFTWPSCGAERPAAFRSIVASHPADYLVVTTGWDEAFRISKALDAREVLKPASGPGYKYVVYRLAPTSQIAVPTHAQALEDDGR